MPENDKPEKTPGDQPAGEEPQTGEGPVRVDEDWKAQVAREKQRLKEQEQQGAATKREEVRDRTMPPADFNSLVASFATQALIQLGQVENPLTGKTGFDPVAAKYTIDLLDMLKNKTRGNLEPEEERQLDTILYDLKMRFVRAQQQPPDAAASGPETKPRP